MVDVCPCGSASAEAACCGPIIAGAPAATAEALMRSRYTAYVRGAIHHVIATHDPATRGALDAEAAARWARETTWRGLRIVARERGGPGDSDGVVEFVARGVSHERSRFRRLAGRWYYVDGDPRPAPGRNDPCPCGSGAKWKRCCG